LGQLLAMKKTLPWIILVIVAASAVGVYFWKEQAERDAHLQVVSVRTAEAPPPPPPVPMGPEIHHPLPKAPVPFDLDGKPLSALSESDDPVLGALTRVADNQALAGLILSSELVRHIVMTIDNLPRDKLAIRRLPLKPPSGQFAVVNVGGGELSPSPANARRYRSYVRLAQTLETTRLIAVYVHFYPLFQQAYEELGYPNLYFNDRVVETIDDLLAAPEMDGKVKLVQPKVLYQFADPDLEELSAGQKIMVRMGPENAAAIKAKLREIRRELVMEPPSASN
jgi:hypothetical protein